MLVVLALGGNALLRRGEPLELDVQRKNLRAAIAEGLAPIARKHQIVVTHGNGPQIGLLALQTAAYGAVPPYSLDVLGAESEGMIGYLIAQSFANELPALPIAVLMTRIEVNAADPAFLSPTKPIGPVYNQPDAHRLAARMGWALVPDAGGFRRAVPSPVPRRIIEIDAIKLLVEARMAVVCAGGGGIPVVESNENGLRGVEAVIDKDYSSALLAEELNADALLLLTDVPSVWTKWPMSEGEPIGHASPEELDVYTFDPGSMGPKVQAACQFVNRTGRLAGIGAIGDAEAILEGRAGTIIRSRTHPRRAA